VGSALVRAFEFSIDPAVIVTYRTENRIDGIMYGAILALLLDQVQIRNLVAKHLNLFVLSALAVGILALLAYFTGTPARRTILAASIPIFIAYTVLRPHELPGRFLELLLMQWLGKLSYSLYVWQMLFFVLVPRQLPLIQSFPGSLIGALSCAVLCHYMLEKPMIRLGLFLSKSKTLQMHYRTGTASS
jgi:peptidoglycan/LPS O-acetylase OafA/YrhL